MSDIALRVSGLGKRYRVGRSPEQYPTLRDRMAHMLTAPARRLAGLVRGDPIAAADLSEDFWALRDASFEVEQGECLGIIGPNGAGKSTLLKILARITQPTEGRAEIRGRVASLLEVGVGFHPELTGRENVFLSGAILGMTRREINARFDEIVGFADIGDLLDTPIKFYSSGMSVRLGFAVAAHLEPEVLLTDEVLAVGDAAFQRKCRGKIGSVARAGRTVLLVSHQMDMVRALCDRCLLIRKGRIVAQGNPHAVVEEYLGGLGCDDNASLVEVTPDPTVKLQITRAQLLDAKGAPCTRFDVFDPILLEIDYLVRSPVEGAVVIFEVLRNGEVLFISFDSDTAPVRLEARAPGCYRARVRLPCPLLKAGHYTLTLKTVMANTQRLQCLESALAFDLELLSRPASFLSYADRRPGALAVPLAWDTVPLETAIPD